MPMHLLTTDQVAAKLGIGRRGAQALIDRELLPATKIGVQWFVEPKDLAQYERRRRQPGRQPGFRPKKSRKGKA